MTSSGENILVGLIALAMRPVIGWRIRRGVRYGQLPLYRSRIDREVAGAKFNTFLVLDALVVLPIAVVAADLLLGLGLQERML